MGTELKYAEGSRWGGFLVEHRIDNGDRLKCKCIKCGRIKVVTRVALYASHLRGAKGCPQCSHGGKGKSRRKKDENGNLLCSSCHRFLPPECYNRRKLNISGKDGMCKQCKREAKVGLEYGLAKEQYQALRESSGGKCAICSGVSRIVIDHDHKTGRIRGMLCGKCNSGLGMFGDSVEKLKLAVIYLENGNQTPYK